VQFFRKLNYKVAHIFGLLFPTVKVMHYFWQKMS
jgi:hypothetical protein